MNVRTFALVSIAMATIGLVGASASTAAAADPWGVEFRIGRSALHVGHGHGRDTSPFRGAYHGGHRHSGHRGFGRGHFDWHDTSHYDWHDTSHYDYVPGGYLRHGRHYHSVPGQWQLHRDGHFDFHRGGHHPRRHFRH